MLSELAKENRISGMWCRNQSLEIAEKEKIALKELEKFFYKTESLIRAVIRLCAIGSENRV